MRIQLQHTVTLEVSYTAHSDIKVGLTLFIVRATVFVMACLPLDVEKPIISPYRTDANSIISPASGR